MADRLEQAQDQEDSRWNDLCVGFIKTVYAARAEYSRRLLQADEARNSAHQQANKRLAATMDEPGNYPPSSLSIAQAGSAHALTVHRLELSYSNENVTAVTQFKNDVEAAAVYLAQRAINIVSAGQG